MTRRAVPLSRQGAVVDEPARQLPIYAEVDVLVVGGGPAGVGATLAAARAGAHTLVIERYGCLGGIWTAGLLNPYFDAKEKGGVPSEIIDRLHAFAGPDAVQDWRVLPQFGTTFFNFEAMKYVLDTMVQEAGARVLLYTQATATIMDGDRVAGVVIENKSGRAAVLAKLVVDSTGDGDIAYGAGCSYEFGREGDGLYQPMTLQFKIGGLDLDIENPGARPNLHEVLTRHNPPEDLARIPFRPPAAVPVAGEPGSAAVMWTHIHAADGTDADDLTRAVIEGRRQVQFAMEAFRAARDEIGDIRLLETAMQVGVRETRRIRGEYYLELDDLLEGRVPEDAVCLVTFGVDIHLPDGNELRAFQVPPYGIPYRCLVPLGAENLLVAGRCISGSHEAHASYRVTGNAVATGEAAGVAAAEAVRTNRAPRELDGTHIRRILERQGVRIRWS